VAVIVAVERLDPDHRHADPACDRKAGGVHVLLDPSGQAAKQYHARWRPRVYALDERGTLRYVQPETLADAQAPDAVRVVWQSSHL
jgi:hypothetical protein